MTIISKIGRRAALAGLTGVAAAAALLAPAAAHAAPANPNVAKSGIKIGYLALSRFNGSLDDNPVANYQATKACPTADRAYGLVALEELGGTFIDTLTAGFTPTAKAPTGKLDSGSLNDQVRAHDLTTGYYRTDVLCYNDDFSQTVVADVNVIKIDIEHNKFSVFPFVVK